MDEEGLRNFKALRAKFQEEALLAQSKTTRPAVAEKPKCFPRPGGHYSSVVSSINIPGENETPAVPRVIFREGLRTSGGKRPISFPPQPQPTSPSSQLTNGDGTARQSLKERHMPLVLPILPVKERKTEPSAKNEHKLEPGKEVLPQTKIKKKGLLLPFKSAKASKVKAENGEEPTYADLTTRPSSAPCALPSVEKQTTEGRALLQSDHSTAELPLSSPDIPTTPPSGETSADSDNKIISTLERARKKFSRRQMLFSAKPKNLHSPDYVSRDKAFPLPPQNIVEPELPIPPPVFLPHMAYLSARPFFKANHSTLKSALDKQFGRDNALPSVRTGKPPPPCALQKKPLPDLRLLGPLPPKPPRPPLVDLSCYHRYTVNEMSPGEPVAEHPFTSNPLLDAPEFPDFENSEMEIAESEAVDISALELEALDLVSTDLPLPDDCGAADVEDPQPDLAVCDPVEPLMSTRLQDLNLGNQNIIPLDPASFHEPINCSEFPEPAVCEQWSQGEEVSVDPLSSTHADETDLGETESHSAAQETDNGHHATLNDGIQPHSNVSQQDSYFESCNNVYEDVENINKFLGQNSWKRRGCLKNPYADNHPMKEEAVLNMWPRNPWGRASEHAHSAHNHVHSLKERQSPDSAYLKEQRKREKHRLEKQRKEQKEREKKENEMKKKFKVSGDEEPMYHAKVMVASKVRKNDLPVKSGDTVGIIRTTSCPKGKWLARDTNNKYGYISVMNVELNIKEMLELGKKAQAAGRGSNMEGDTISIGSRSSTQLVLTSSFTDDSEEWACEDDTLSPPIESHFPHQTVSLPEMSCGYVSTQHTLSDANLEDLHTQTRHEALQKLAIFFQHTKDEFSDIPDSGGATPTNAEQSSFLFAVEEPPYPEQEADFTELELLPPPPLYADTF
ncbi:FYN-binding protein 2 isoform X3 [Perca fluviatilis]|uniref:FYN-binding protein 2 isoform X3 n=1 Tax=Perca fluviatilis TaxID=8168 RepID=UPI001964B675|nr:FYN-binding protein 2 isoform X3 [Perca fluviatilis]